MCPQHAACQPCSYKKRRQPIAETYQFHIVFIEKSENQQQSDSVIQDRITQIIFRSHHLHMGNKIPCMTIPTSVSITVMPNNTVGNFGLWIRFNSLPVCSGSPIWRTASCAAARVSFPPGDSPPSVPQCDCQSPCGLRIWHGDSRSVLLWHPDNPGCFRHSANPYSLPPPVVLPPHALPALPFFFLFHN